MIRLTKDLSTVYLYIKVELFIKIDVIILKCVLSLLLVIHIKSIALLFNNVQPRRLFIQPVHFYPNLI